MSSSAPTHLAPPPSETAPATPRVLFLGGLGRSGTTLLERVLDELPGVCAVGEVVHLWRRAVLDGERCGCGAAFRACPFWRAVGERAFGGWDRELAVRMELLRARVDRTRHIPALLLGGRRGARARALAEYVSVYRRLYAAIAEVSGAAVVVDSSKHSSLAYCLATDPGVDLRVVHVVRDSRGVAYSWTKEVRRPEGSGDRELMTRYSPARSSALWTGHNVVLSALGRLGTRTRLLRYEDFVATPAEVLEDLAAFADLPGAAAQEVLDGRTVVLSPSHTVAGNPMRFRTGPTQLRRDDEWRRNLARPRRALVSLLTLPLLARYGYLRRADR